MKVKKLTEAYALLERIASDAKMEPAHSEEFRTAKRELKRIMRSGKLDRRQVFRVVALISATLYEALRARSEQGD